MKTEPKIQKTGEKKMNDNKKSRFFVGMRNMQFETHNEKGEKILDITEDEWKAKVIEELEAVDASELAYIFHNRDVDDEGNPKTLHVHFTARFDNPRQYKTTREAFGCASRNFTKGRSEAAALNYFCHTTPQAIKSRKTRYNVAEITVKLKQIDEETKEVTYIKPTGEDLEKWYRIKISGKQGDAVTTEEDVARIIDELAEGTMKLTDVKQELRDLFDPTTATMTWMRNKRLFKEAVSEFWEAKYNEQLDKGRGNNFNLVYIDGLSGIGKTRFANNLARYYNKQKGEREGAIHNAPNDSKGARYDFLSSYNNELVTVFDDLKPTTFGYTEFLNLFEKERVAKYSSRFSDKPWFAELAIITKSTHVSEWTRSLSHSEIAQTSYSKKDNVLYQPRRRFSYIIKLESDKVTVSNYQLLDSKTNQHELTPIAEIKVKKDEDFYSDKFQRRVLKEIGKLLGVVETTEKDTAKVVLNLERQQSKLREIKEATAKRSAIATKRAKRKEENKEV